MQTVNTNSPLIKRSRQEAVLMASSMIGRCTEAAMNSLEEAERQAQSLARRQQLGEAMGALTRHRGALRSGYGPKVDAAIGDALHNASLSGGERAAPAATRSMQETPDFQLSLIEEDEVARFVEASRLQQAAMPVVEDVLTRLDSLMSSVMGLPVVRPDLNPLRPDVLCGALLELVDSQPESAATRSLWARHMAKPFARELKQLYETVASQLQGQGVGEARYRLKLTEGGPAPKAGPAGAAPAGTPAQTAAAAVAAGAPATHAVAHPHAMPNGVPVRMMDLAHAQPAISQALMRDFLYQPQWMAQHDGALPATYYQAVQKQVRQMEDLPAVTFDEAAYAQMLAQQRRISAVDRPARAVNVEMALPPNHWGEEASPAWRTHMLMELKAQAQKMSQALGLNAVRALINQVAADDRLLAPVREAFVALEPALLRMAMADPRFFGDDNHPARLLVEGVAQRSFKYNNEFDEAFEEFMRPVREAVHRLNIEADITPQAFSEKLQHLQALWRAEDESDQKRQDEGLRSISFAQERQMLADKIALDLSLRPDLNQVPTVVADFLFEVWSLVIAHAQLTDTRNQLDPGGYLAIVTDLLWSAKRQEVLNDPARLFETLPPMLQTLRRGLDMLGKDPQEAEPFFNMLMRIHDPVLRLRRLRSAQDAEASGFAKLGTASLLMNMQPVEDDLPISEEKPQPRARTGDERPWLGRHELAHAGFEEGITSAADLIQEGSDDGFPPTRPMVEEAPHHWVDTQPTDPPSSAQALLAAQKTAKTKEYAEEAKAEARATLERMRKGDWVDLYVRGDWRRAQINWISNNGALYMFVSRGGRPHSMTRRTCEKLLLQRHIRPVDSTAVMENAVRRLPQKINTPQEELA